MMGFRAFDLPTNKILLYESKHLPGDSVTSHHHTIYQILYILNGSGTILLDKQPYEVESDQMVLIAPFSEHAVFAQSRMTLLVLAFDGLLKMIGVAETLLERVFSKSKYHIVHTMAANELRDSFRKILHEQTMNSPFADVAIQNHLLQVLLILARSFEGEAFPDSNAYRANILKHHIEMNYYDQMSAQDLANRIRLTSRHMNAIFKEQFHITPMQYLNDVRVKHAQELLSETEKDIVSICFEVGFETVSTFYRSFKKRVGLSPEKFRKSPSE